MRKLEIERERPKYHEGWFHETFESTAPSIGAIALLHVDPDMYEPVRLSLATWYPKLSPGGFVQFDDYEAFVGCKRAVDEFLQAHPSLSLETFGRGGGRAYFLRKHACEGPRPGHAAV
jgi:O-methyltransferase